jgi:peptidoglycan hydrolase-like protein with peptidoglycan-binding domain
VRLLRPLTGVSPAPWPTSAPPTLQRGDIGPWVSFLQQQLVRGGWPVVVDGRFGPGTDAALRGAQEAAGLAPDGVTGKATWTALTSPSTPIHVLRPDGFGTVDFGAAATEALGALTELFGEPERQTRVDPDRECVEGSPWSDCVPVVDDARIVSWSARGLDVLFTDAGPDEGKGASHFGAWHVVAATAPPTLTTTDGLAAGATVADLRRVHPNVQFFTNEGVVDVFAVETPTGTYLGALAWDSYAQHVQALQKALNAHGADLAVDGTPGPRTEQACREFAAAMGLVTDGCPNGWLTDELADALGLPPPDIRIASLAAQQQ